MEYLVEICHSIINIANIKEYAVFDVPYVFRPVFVEQKKGLRAMFSSEKYVFAYNIPYGAIVGSQTRQSFIEKGFPNTSGQAVFQELAYGVADKLAEVFKLNAIKEKKLSIMEPSGQIIQTRFDEIPVQVKLVDGQFLEVRKWDEIGKELASRMNSQIVPVKCLKIRFSTPPDSVKYYFGDGIHSDNILNDYGTLKQAHVQYLVMLQENKAENKPKKPQIKLPKVDIPQIEMPKVELPKVVLPKIEVKLFKKKEH